MTHVKLSWTLLEHKVRYYILDAPIVSDAVYDQMEKEYKALCKKLRKPDSITNMVGVDMNRESVKRAYEKVLSGGV